MKMTDEYFGKVGGGNIYLVCGLIQGGIFPQMCLYVFDGVGKAVVLFFQIKRVDAAYGSFV